MSFRDTNSGLKLKKLASANGWEFQVMMVKNAGGNGDSWEWDEFTNIQELKEEEDADLSFFPFFPSLSYFFVYQTRINVFLFSCLNLDKCNALK